MDRKSGALYTTKWRWKPTVVQPKNALSGDSDSKKHSRTLSGSIHRAEGVSTIAAHGMARFIKGFNW
ncbi:TPA: hypothetical protein ACIO8I_002291, partial [Salmonella enterica subsp. enterica serovar Lexington]